MLCGGTAGPPDAIVPGHLDPMLNSYSLQRHEIACDYHRDARTINVLYGDCDAPDSAPAAK